MKLFHTGHPAMLHNEQDQALVLQPADAKDENLGVEILPACKELSFVKPTTRGKRSKLLTDLCCQILCTSQTLVQHTGRHRVCILFNEIVCLSVLLCLDSKDAMCG